MTSKNPLDTRIYGPVPLGYGNTPSGVPDVSLGTRGNSLRTCNCCGEAQVQIKAYSHNAKRGDYSHTCKSCCNFIWLFSKEWADDYEAKPKIKRTRLTAAQKAKIEKGKELERLRIKEIEHKKKQNTWLQGIPKLTVWRHI